jgi:long-chain fatty acid transport protein
MRRAFIVLGSLALSSVARGAGYEFPDNGAVAMGRAGAFAAKADDPTAIYYNPAGLAAQEGLHLLFDSHLLVDSISYQRTTAPVDGSTTNIGPQVTNSAGLFYLPFLAVSTRIIPDVTLALGVYAPPATGLYAFPDPYPNGGMPPTATPSDQNNCLQLQSQIPAGQPHCPGYNISSTSAPQGYGVAPQLYNLINEKQIVLYPTLAVGWQALPWLAVGGSLQLAYGQVNLRQGTYDGATLEVTTKGVPPVHNYANSIGSYNTIANLSVSAWSFTGILGVTVTPIEPLRIGLSVRPQYTANASGTLTLDFSPLAQSTSTVVSGPGTAQANPQVGSGPANLTVPFPTEIKSGVDYTFENGADIELDFNYEVWSNINQITLAPQFSTSTSGGPATAVPPVVFPKRFMDSWSLRLGADYPIPLPSMKLTVRAGVGYESSIYNLGSNATSYPSLDFSNFAEYFGSLGADLQFLGFIDVVIGYTHVFEPTETVTNAGTALIQNNPPNPTGPMVVGNGVYHTQYDIVDLGLRLNF